MTPTLAEPIVIHLGPVDSICPQEYPKTYAHLINIYCFDLKPSKLFLYYNYETQKRRYCQFCFEKLDQEIQNKCEFFTSWHSAFKLECIYIFLA